MGEVTGGASGKAPIILKVGPGFEFDGMHPDVEPQDLPKNVPRQLINMRLRAGRAETRGGQTQVADLDTAVMGMEDINLGMTQLILAGEGAPGASPNSGNWIGTYDEQQDPVIQRVVVNQSAFGNYRIGIGKYAGDLYFGDAFSGAGLQGLFKMRQILQPRGVEAFEASNGKQAVKIWSLPSGYDRVRAIIEFNGELFVSLLGVSGMGLNSAIYRYDGVTFTLDLGGIEEIGGFGVFRESLIAIGSDGTASTQIRIRDIDGNWTTEPVVTGIVFMTGNSTVSYKDRLYICPRYQGSSATAFQMYDGSTLAAVYPVAVPAGGDVKCITKAYGYLYYAWNDAGGAGDTYLGRYDGTTWTPTHKNLTDDFGVGAAYSLGFYREKIVLSWLDINDDLLPRLKFSPIGTSVGAWTEELFPVVPSVPIVEMLVL